jgi:adenylate cyclase class 2
MELEIEKKAWIKNIEELENRLKEIAVFSKTDEKSDTYYYMPSDGREIDFKNDPIFRIRKTKKGSFIAYKKRDFSGETEVNQENEFEIITPEKIEGLIEYVGYKVLVKKHKFSRVYSYKNASIELNTIDGLGDFIEVEVILTNEDEKERAFEVIDEVFEILNIDKNNIETRYYIDLLLNK